MRRISSFVVLLGVFLLMMLSGFVQASDYTFSNGYYYKNGQAHTRSIYNYYDSHGCLVSAYRYTAVATAAPDYKYEKVDWRSKLLEIAKQQKEYDAKLKASTADHNEYMEALDALGLKGSLGNHYGSQVASVDAYSQRTAPQGQTVYGYNEIADIYGNVDLGALYNSAIRLAENSNRYGADATSGAMNLVDKLSDRSQGLLSQQLAIAEINAKANGATNVARALGESLKAESRIHIERRGVGNAPVNPQPPAPAPDGGSPILNEPSAQAADVRYDKVTALVQAKCYSCHGGKTTEGNLNLGDLSKLDDAAVAKILARVTSPDSTKRMPPNKPLSGDELRVIFDATR